MTLEAMYEAAIQAVRQRSVIRPSLDDLAKAAVDAALAEAKKVKSFPATDTLNETGEVVAVDEPGTYAIVRIEP